MLITVRALRVKRIPMKSTAGNGASYVISLFLFSCFYFYRLAKRDTRMW